MARVRARATWLGGGEDKDKPEDKPEDSESDSKEEVMSDNEILDEEVFAEL